MMIFRVPMYCLFMVNNNAIRLGYINNFYKLPRMSTMMILLDVIEEEVVEDIKTGLALFRTIPHMVCLLTTPLPQLK